MVCGRKLQLFIVSLLVDDELAAIEVVLLAWRFFDALFCLLNGEAVLGNVREGVAFLAHGYLLGLGFEVMLHFSRD